MRWPSSSSDDRVRHLERTATKSRTVRMMPRIPLAPSRQSPGEASVSPMDTPEPIQIGLNRQPLSQEARQWRQQHNLCEYCGDARHYVRNCPTKAHKLPHSVLMPSPTRTAPSQHLLLPILFQLPEGSILVPAIIDSGACSGFMDSDFATGFSCNPWLIRASRGWVHTQVRTGAPKDTAIASRSPL